MSKKGKGSTPNSPTSNLPGSADTKNTKPVEDETIPNPNFFFGTDEFKLDNGDTYEGQYCCHKTGIVWREGDGVYITKDRHIYQGQWENDQLLNSTNSCVRYPTGEEYWGSIVNGKYNGYGTYIMDNKLRITCDFQNNVPVGEITLTDYEGHLWKGIAEEERAIFLRENHYFQSIPPSRGIGKQVKVKQKINEKIKEESLPQEITQDMVFKKSSKTYNDFFDTNELLSKEHVKDSSFVRVDDAILTEESSQVSVSLLKKFLSKDYRKQTIPITTISPQINNKIQDYNNDVLQTEG